MGSDSERLSELLLGELYHPSFCFLNHHFLYRAESLAQFCTRDNRIPCLICSIIIIPLLLVLVALSFGIHW